MTSKPFLILDACVLIDFCLADRTVLHVVSRHVGSIHVPSPVFDEVHHIRVDEAPGLGIVVVDPQLDQLAEAGNRRGGLSFQDRLCVIMARDQKWTCVSNDGAVRKSCTQENVPVLWGLELMGLAVKAGALRVENAEGIALAIHRENSFITLEIVQRFGEKAKRGWR